MKKWKLAVILALGLIMTTVTFSSVQMSAYAYTDEEKQMAKDWLSAHGYSPTMSGAEQAYQDYLNGMWGGPGGDSEETSPQPTEPLPTETEIPVEAIQPVVEKVEKVMTTVTEEETTTEEATSDEMTTEESSETVSEEGMTETNSTEVETMSATFEEAETESETEALVTFGRYDGIIVVVAIAACAAMIGGTIYYIKKSKKDGV